MPAKSFGRIGGHAPINRYIELGRLDRGDNARKTRRPISAQYAQDQADFFEDHQGESGTTATPPAPDRRGACFELGATHLFDKHDGAFKAPDRMAIDEPPVAYPRLRVHGFLLCQCGNTILKP